MGIYWNDLQPVVQLIQQWVPMNERSKYLIIALHMRLDVLGNLQYGSIWKMCTPMPVK